MYVPSRSRSEIWKYFKIKEDNIDQLRWAVCNKCPDKPFAFNGTTTHMWRHVRRVHSIEKPTRLQ